MTSAIAQSGEHVEGQRSELFKLALAALGVVYGDIGTSPLYAVKECFNGEHGVRVTDMHVLGVISLVFWSLVWVVVIKYLTFVLRVDNKGEGGMFALIALVTGKPTTGRRRRAALILLGLFGAGLLYGDGMITPAISVLSAVEGLGVATHAFEPVVVPITVIILVGLFLAQKRGTAGVGAIFGPLTLVWFITIAVMGVPWILREPRVLEAVNPIYAATFIMEGGWHAFLVLGAVVLCITGGEALYADMGHFGKKPIRIAWYAVAFPALLLNYFGQGALLLSRGAHASSNPFYALVHGWQIYPVVVIATIATVVASQAMISGAFSLTHQAVQLGYMPRVTIVHTSGKTEGQIYIPEVNTALMVSCIALVLVFRESSALAAAYGIAVTGSMLVTSVFFFVVKKSRWGLLRALGLSSLFMVVDLAFFGANTIKIPHGGWFPLVMGAIIFVVMTTWKRGREALGAYVRSTVLPLEPFLESIEKEPPQRVPGTAVFMTSNPDGLPPALRHFFQHGKVLHDQILLLNIVIEHVPTVPRKNRAVIKELRGGFYHVVAYYGFRQSPRVAGVLRECRKFGLKIEDEDVSFFLGRETLIIMGKSNMARWRARLFSFLSRNARPATAYYDIPPDRVVELGMQIKL